MPRTNYRYERYKTELAKKKKKEEKRLKKLNKDDTDDIQTPENAVVTAPVDDQSPAAKE